MNSCTAYSNKRAFIRKLGSCNEEYLKQHKFELELDITKLRGELNSNDAKLREKIMSSKGKIRQLFEKSEVLKGEQDKLVNTIEKLNNELLEREVGIEASKKVFAIETGHMLREINDLKKSLQSEVGIKMEILPELDGIQGLIFNQTQVHEALEQEGQFLNQTITEAQNPKTALQNTTMQYPGASVTANSYALQNMRGFNNTYQGPGTGQYDTYQGPSSRYRPSLPGAQNQAGGFDPNACQSQYPQQQQSQNSQQQQNQYPQQQQNQYRSYQG